MSIHTIYKLSAALSVIVLIVGISVIMLFPEEDAQREPRTKAIGSAIRVEWDDHLWVEYTANGHTHLVHHPGCPCLVTAPVKEAHKAE